MKKFIIISIIATTFLGVFSACTTYDEGPGFTVIPAEKRIQGTWEQTELYINDQLQDGTFKIEFKFDSDGTGTRTTTAPIVGTTTDDIEWQFNDDKTLLMFKDTGADEWDEATILRLTTKEFWIREDAGIFGIWQFRYEKV